ncbi:MAG: hypothetical protein KatS3mg115_0165 [Candidatus Poribacteria bacterium]|nr:MAG: hypothetical protein KatS3mg115_0165 [Candidatus Poribacteria bacterium]
MGPLSSERKALAGQLRQDAARLAGRSPRSLERVELVPNEPVNRADRFWERSAQPRYFWAWIGVGLLWAITGLLAFGAGIAAVYLWTMRS